MKQQNYGEIRQLLKCIKESGAAAKNDGDNVILNCLDEFDAIPSEVCVTSSTDRKACTG